MKITEFVTKRKTLILVVLEGVKGNGWEALRTISLVQDLFDQAVRASKETIEDSQRVRAFTEDVGPMQMWLQRKDLGTELCC